MNRYKFLKFMIAAAFLCAHCMPSKQNAPKYMKMMQQRQSGSVELQLVETKPNPAKTMSYMMYSPSYKTLCFEPDSVLPNGRPSDVCAVRIIDPQDNDINVFGAKWPHDEFQFWSAFEGWTDNDNIYYLDTRSELCKRSPCPFNTYNVLSHEHRMILCAKESSIANFRGILIAYRGETIFAVYDTQRQRLRIFAKPQDGTSLEELDSSPSQNQPSFLYSPLGLYFVTEQPLVFRHSKFIQMTQPLPSRMGRRPFAQLPLPPNTKARAT